MKNYITIDGGTTNTRVSIVSDGIIKDTLKLPSNNDTTAYKNELKNKIEEILSKNGYNEKDIIRILVSGTMATSEFGLYPIDHLVVPVDIKKLKENSCEIIIPEISNIPIVIIRGVKTSCDTLQSADMMRGEEAELMGLMSPGDKSSVYMLMGSHSKIVKTDDFGNITDICTMLTGELIGAVSKNTILKHSLVFDGVCINEEFLKKGYIYCHDNGINETAFKVRVLKNIFNATESEIYSFFVGAILCGEIQYVIKSQIKKIIVGGNKILKEAVCILLKEYLNAQIIMLTETQVDNSVSTGLVKIFEYQL